MTSQPLPANLWVPTGLWIGGKEAESSDGGRFDVLDPATALPIARVASATVEDGLAAVDAAAAAAGAWRGTAPRGRGEILRKAFELMTERSEDLARSPARPRSAAPCSASRPRRWSTPRRNSAAMLRS